MAGFYGMNWHPNWIDPAVQDSEMDLMKQAGTQSVRIDAQWYYLEQSQGVYQPTYFARMDHAVNGLLARGIKPVVVVTSTPQWVSQAPVNDPDAMHEPPLRTNLPAGCDSAATICASYDHTQEYSNFLSYLVQRWSGKVQAYEVWNEPDGNWSWRSPNAVDYTSLLKAAYAAVKQVDPSVTILGGSLSGSDASQQSFVNTMYNSGAHGYFDVWSQHYYGDPPRHGNLTPEQLATSFSTNIYPILQAHGDGGIPVWITETGYGTYAVGGAINETQQADYLLRTYAVARTLPNVQQLYTYTFDGTGAGSDPDNYYGLVDALTYNVNSLTSLRVKPAYTAFRDMTSGPSVALASPVNGGSVASSVTISASASDNVGVAGVQFKLDGANLGSEDTASPYSVAWNTATAVNGPHTLTAIAHDAAGNQATSQTFTVNVKNPIVHVALYRLSSSYGAHFYTTSIPEVISAIQLHGYHLESVAAYVANDPNSGLSPLYRLVYPKNATFYYTALAASRDIAIKAGYIDLGVAAYVASSPGTGLTPLYSLYVPATTDYFYTTSTTELLHAAAIGYRYTGIVGYVFTSP